MKATQNMFIVPSPYVQVIKSKHTWHEGKSYMFYAIDIDGTIANPEPGLIAFHNHDFGPGLTAEELNGT